MSSSNHNALNGNESNGKSKAFRKLEPLVNMKSQTKLLSDGSRVAACLIGEELLQYNFEDARTLCEAIRHGERVSNNGPMLGYRQTQPDGSQPYVWLTYRQVIDRSINFAYGLLAIGIIPGQETFVAIYAKNRPEWTISELAVYNNSSVVVSLYDTLGATSRSFIINQASIEVVICDDEAKAASLVKSKHECPTLKYIVMMCDFSKDFNESANAVGISVYTFMEIEKRGSDLSPKPPLKAPKPCDVCTICYTSGTTGVPKGVILTHGNIIAATTTYQFLKNTHFTSEDVAISYLPLAHMYERVVENMVFQFGARVGFFRGDIKKLGDDIKELKPTFVPLVPRILTRIFDAVIADVQKSFIRKRVFNVAIAYKKRLVQNSIFLSTANLFKGQTECSAIGTSGLEADTSPGHVGIPLVCSAIKLVDVPELGYFAKNGVGEICIRGHNVFKGYYKNEEATRETIDENGWLHSGDIGKWTENGTLKIIDRKKHIFKLQQGEYIAPEKIENVYGHSRYISQVFVHGESLKTCLVAIVVPDEKTLRETAKEEMGIQDATLEELCSNAALKKVIMDDMIDIGKKGGLQSFEQVKDIYVSSERFTIENDLLTPTLKGRRPNIQKHFAEQIEEMYSKLK
uniref:long-chain-fatty-acid--CoA ligase n=1 Tax=Ascaris lumbricoides TaxID=6252 RepID=A0A9J2P5C3_ASCLU